MEFNETEQQKAFATLGVEGSKILSTALNKKLIVFVKHELSSTIRK
jgi:hypothetical protein